MIPDSFVPKHVPGVQPISCNILLPMLADDIGFDAIFSAVTIRNVKLISSRNWH